MSSLICFVCFVSVAGCWERRSCHAVFLFHEPSRMHRKRKNILYCFPCSIEWITYIPLYIFCQSNFGQSTMLFFQTMIWTSDNEDNSWPNRPRRNLCIVCLHFSFFTPVNFASCHHCSICSGSHLEVFSCSGCRFTSLIIFPAKRLNKAPDICRPSWLIPWTIP